ASVVQATLNQVRCQPFRDYEIWVIDQSDPSDAASNARYVKDSGDARIHYLHLTQKGPSNARNEGFARARGEIVIGLDDDVILLSEDFIGAHVRAYADATVGGVTGRHVERIVRMNSRHTACHVSWNGRTVFNLFGLERVEVGSVKGSNMSFRMAVVRQVGGFDRRTPFLEETDFSTRVRAAGWRLMYEPEAELVHLSIPSGGTREKNALESESRRFESTAYYMRKHRGPLGVASFIVTFMLIAMVRAFRFRSLKVIPTLYSAMFQGFADAGKEPDQLLPKVQEMAET
ncbi:MAG: glycosyltransferase family 2 protein, partial [Acidocella sp.]|uniref:glycosyltransferase family 2 protein n=1 Tax=Acidocella sp. TaxID=50710 RepID=UPI003FD8B17B